MRICKRIRPLIARHHEGELTPDEAIQVARHVPLCTACRILDARERRLVEMLSSDLLDLPVDEEFASSVMNTLPKEPFRRRRPILRLAIRVG